MTLQQHNVQLPKKVPHQWRSSAAGSASAAPPPVSALAAPLPLPPPLAAAAEPMLPLAAWRQRGLGHQGLQTLYPLEPRREQHPVPPALLPASPPAGPGTWTPAAAPQVLPHLQAAAQAAAQPAKPALPAHALQRHLHLAAARGRRGRSPSRESTCDAWLGVPPAGRAAPLRWALAAQLTRCVLPLRCLLLLLFLLSPLLLLALAAAVRQLWRG